MDDGEGSIFKQSNAGTEPQIFKTKFSGWNDVIAVDFTRTADSVRKTGADLAKWAAEQETKVSLHTTSRPPPDHLQTTWNGGVLAVSRGRPLLSGVDTTLALFGLWKRPLFATNALLQWSGYHLGGLHTTRSGGMVSNSRGRPFSCVDTTSAIFGSRKRSAYHLEWWYALYQWYRYHLGLLFA